MFSESLGGFIESTFIGGKEGGMRLGPSQQNSNFDVFSLKAENFLKCFKCFVGLFLLFVLIAILYRFSPEGWHGRWGGGKKGA